MVWDMVSYKILNGNEKTLIYLLVKLLLLCILGLIIQQWRLTRRYIYWWVKIRIWHLQSKILYVWKWFQVEVIYGYIWYKILKVAYLKVRRKKFTEEWYKIYKLYWAKNRTYIVDQVGYLWVLISWNFQKNYILYLTFKKWYLTYFNFRDRAARKWYSLKRKR